MLTGWACDCLWEGTTGRMGGRCLGRTLQFDCQSAVAHAPVSRWFSVPHSPIGLCCETTLYPQSHWCTRDHPTSTPPLIPLPVGCLYPSPAHLPVINPGPTPVLGSATSSVLVVMVSLLSFPPGASDFPTINRAGPSAVSGALLLQLVGKRTIHPCPSARWAGRAGASNLEEAALTAPALEVPCGEDKSCNSSHRRGRFITKLWVPCWEVGGSLVRGC